MNDYPLIKAGSHIISLNMEQVIMAQDDPGLKDIIINSELIIPDGSSVVLSLKFLFNARYELDKVAGIDLAEKLISEKQRIAILGSTQEVVDILKEKYKNKIVFAENGFFPISKEDDIAKKISDSKPEVLLVGMGIPRQEKFINKYHKSLFENFISMGVGGTLDVLAGKRLRAPKWTVKLHLEWLFRLIQEPLRIKRIYRIVFRYLLLLMLFKLKMC